MSVTYGKQGLVELHGAGSANVEKVPNISQCARISKTENCFYYKGNLDGRICRFKIDTGSDVSVLSEKFLKEPKKYLEIKDFCLTRNVREPGNSKNSETLCASRVVHP